MHTYIDTHIHVSYTILIRYKGSSNFPIDSVNGRAWTNYGATVLCYNILHKNTVDTIIRVMVNRNILKLGEKCIYF